MMFQVMKDSQLFLVVGILLTMDIIIMTTWQVFDPFFRKTEDLRPYVSILSYPQNLLSSYPPILQYSYPPILLSSYPPISSYILLSSYPPILLSS